MSLRRLLHAAVELSAHAGLAAGFDKDAEAVEGLLGMGFGFVEIGALFELCAGAIFSGQL